MQVSISIPSEEGAIALESTESGQVRVVLGTQSVKAERSLIERAVTNALNVGIKPNENFSVLTKVSDETGSVLTVENHPTNRELAVVKIGGGTRSVKGRELIAAARKC